MKNKHAGPGSLSNLLLTGPPGCGKTTVVNRAVEQLGRLRIAGFYTGELRDAGRRTGFEAVGLGTGRSALLASVRSKSRIRVGRYGVELCEFEGLLAAEFPRPMPDVDLAVIDEIGKMECYSPFFIEIVRDLLDGPAPLLATVAQKGAGLIRDVKGRADVDLLTVTVANRDRLPEQLVRRLTNQPG
jgi:nucleoside-triphosphatase